MSGLNGAVTVGSGRSVVFNANGHTTSGMGNFSIDINGGNTITFRAN